MELPEELRRWTEAGLLSAEQAERIASFEGARAAPAAETAGAGGGITPTEVVAYAGTVVILVGLAFLFGIQHDQLGSAGRLLILGLVVAGGLGTGFFLEPRSSVPASRRARSAALALAILALLAFFSEMFVDAHLLSRPAPNRYEGSDESGNVILAAAIASAAGIFLLFRTWSGLVSVALAVCVFSTAGAAVAYARLAAGWGPEALFLVGGALLVVCAELGRADREAGPVEILSFAGVMAPVVAALILSSEPAGRGLEPFAAGLAITSFTASILRGSPGYAVAGGLSLFLVTLEVGFRHFAQSLGFPVVLIAAGLVLLAIAVALVRLLPRFGRPRRDSGHLGGDDVDLREQFGE